MNTQIILVDFAIVILQVVCAKSITVTDNLRQKIALEVLKVSPVSTVVSPFALSLPLCKLASIARGHAKEELMSALGIAQETEVEKYYSGIFQEISLMKQHDMMLQNVIYLNESLEVDPHFKNTSRQYGVRIDKAGFQYPKAAVKYMNRWFAQETLYRVSTLVDEDDIDNTTSMIILNGLYLKIGLNTPFNVQYTKPRKFYDSANKLWMIPMMSKIDSFDYLDDVNNNVQVLSLMMATPGTSITFFLPETKTGLPDLIKKISDNPQLIKRTMALMQPTILRVYLPRMKIKTYVDWTGFMRLIGINDIFSANVSGLEGMLKNNSTSLIYLSKAKQKVFIEMEEMMMKRAQFDEATRMREAREYAYFGDEVKQFELDHPFFFVVTLAGGRQQYQMLTGAFYGPQEE